MEMPNALVSLNQAAALERVGGDLQLLQEVAKLFLEECPKLMQDIRAAVTASEARGLERAAHSLKGSVGNFGAEPAFQAAYQLEALGRNGDLSHAPEALLALEAALSQLEPELAALCADLD